MGKLDKIRDREPPKLNVKDELDKIRDTQLYRNSNVKDIQDKIREMMKHAWYSMPGVIMN